MENPSKITPDEVQQALFEMVELGLVQTSINEAGEVTYQLTEEDHKHFNR